MIDKKLIEKIKKACEINNELLFEEFNNGVITDESISEAYEMIFNKRKTESIKNIDRTTIASRCAVMCYKRSVANDDI